MSDPDPAPACPEVRPGGPRASSPSSRSRRGVPLPGAALLAVLLALGACAPTKGENGKFDVLHTDNEDFEVSYIDVGIHPTQVAAGDIDGDGRTDLVVTNRFSDSLTILTGGLEDSQTILTTKEPSDVVIADLDGANGLDLAVVSARGRTVTIYLNDGDGGWTQSDLYEFLGVITQLAAVDLNGDESTTKDLVFTVSIDNLVVALVNDGSGGFTEVQTGVGIGPGRFVTGLFGEESQNLDMAVLSTPRDTVSILLGEGDGRFTIKEGSTINTRLNPRTLISLDVNNDGITDLAVSSPAEEHVSVYRGSSTGHFSTYAEKKLLPGGDAMVAGPFDTPPDGAPNDIAIVHRNRRIVTLLFWDPNDRNFVQHRVHVHEDPFAIVTADFNVDGCADLAVVDNDLRALSILAGDCKGEFTHSTIGFASSPSYPLVVDLDGDGGRDIVAVQPQNKKLIVLRNVH